MKHRGLSAVVGVLVALGVGPSMIGIVRAQADPAHLAFEAARKLEVIDRDIRGAIAAYRDVAARYASDRDVSASALLRLAICYEIVGDDQAVATYERLAGEYSDQPTVVATARERLAALTGPAHQADPLRPHYWSTASDFPVAISADGQYGVLVTNQALVLQDLASQSETVLVSRTGSGSQASFARWPAISPDGSRVAYNWRVPGTLPGNALRVIETRARAVPRTLVDPIVRDAGRLVPVGWSPNGVDILALNETATTTQLVWVAAADGAVRPITSFESWRGVPLAGGRPTGFQGPKGVSLSPDGSTIAFSAVAREGSEERYIFTIGASGQNETAIVQVAGRSEHPVWTPDGGNLIFVNEGSSGRGLWTVPVAGGRAIAPPSPVRDSFDGHLVDMAHTGQLFYLRAGGEGFSEYVLDRSSGLPRIVGTFRGQGATWAKDNRLASIRGPAHDLIVRQMDTGEERTYSYADLNNSSPRWLNPNSLVVYTSPSCRGCAYSAPAGTFYRLDIDTGVFTRLFDRDTSTHRRSTVLAVSPDGGTIYMTVRPTEDGSWTGIVAVDVATGEETLTATFPGSGLSSRSDPGLAISPDGAVIAIRTWSDDQQAGRIVTLRTDGTDYRELRSGIAGGGWPYLLQWTPDGQSILFPEGNAAGWRMMRIPAGGGEPLFDGLDSSQISGAVPFPEFTGIVDFDVSADGSRLVFTSRMVPTYEVWSLDNVWSAARQQ